ncbi:MAG: 5'/3'-nucleotidase SurE [Selenomonadales bacterium]|nr:5'/3'-nucleotidase SurE [Selenomonadales bacterium]
MRILLSNDDGVMAPGIRALANALREVGEVFVVAPDGERSATSHSITVHDPIRVDAVDMGEGITAWKCSGTPVDCVKLGIEGLKIDADVVISGINAGYNLGTDVLYSGTVGAAVEGFLHDIPSFAFSFEGKRAEDMEVVAREAIAVLRRFYTIAAEEKMLINVNFPPLRDGGYQGVRVAPLGRRDYANTFIKRQDPTGRTYYWMGGTPLEETKSIDSDTTAIRDGYISVTPLQIDFTDHARLALLNNKA